MKNILLILIGLVILTFKIHAQTVTDIDGNVYNTVTIGTQVWLKENLKVTRFNNGDGIPHDTDNVGWEWAGEAYCNYENDSNNGVIYGHLYNWIVASDWRNVCPTGWHVPTDSEWSALTNYLGGSVIAGGKLKEVDTIHWMSPNIGATNESGFTALPGGDRFSMGSFYSLREMGFWWCSNAGMGYGPWARVMGNNSAGIDKIYATSHYGFSIRCLRDMPADVNDLIKQQLIEIFPNPAIDKITINISEKTHLRISIYNIIGELVLERELSESANVIYVSFLTTGVYIMQISCDDRTFQKKMIKE